MASARERVIERILQYLRGAEDWDVYEIAEWTFGYDDLLIEQFREEINLKEIRANEGSRTDKETTAVQS